MSKKNRRIGVRGLKLVDFGETLPLAAVAVSVWNYRVKNENRELHMISHMFID